MTHACVCQYYHVYGYGWGGEWDEKEEWDEKGGWDEKGNGTRGGVGREGEWDGRERGRRGILRRRTAGARWLRCLHMRILGWSRSFCRQSWVVVMEGNGLKRRLKVERYGLGLDWD